VLSEREIGFARSRPVWPPTRRLVINSIIQNQPDKRHHFGGAIVIPCATTGTTERKQAPKSSARYEPELPLTQASVDLGTLADSSDGRKLEQSGHLRSRPPAGAQNSDLQAPETQTQTQIDYTQYFANFNSRPIEQHLMLDLKLEKKHFMVGVPSPLPLRLPLSPLTCPILTPSLFRPKNLQTPDSSLRLRCSSTQAKVLMADSATLTIIGIEALQPSQSARNYRAWSQRPNQQKLHNFQKGLHQPAPPGSSPVHARPRASAAALHSSIHGPLLVAIFVSNFALQLDFSVHSLSL